jgi:hypothetical protein
MRALLSILLSFCSRHSSAVGTYSAAHDFSATSNPNGAWRPDRRLGLEEILVEQLHVTCRLGFAS